MDDLWCGIDWAEGHHDISVIDDSGAVLVKERISDDIAGFGRLTELVLDHRPDGLSRLPIAIETAQGLLVAALGSAGADVFPINPLSVSRYRDRYSPSRAKSDSADAIVLANILRTDRDNHRRLPQDSDQAQSIRVLARAHQDAIWDSAADHQNDAFPAAPVLSSVLAHLRRLDHDGRPGSTPTGADPSCGRGPAPLDGGHHLWALPLILHSPDARAHYDRRRDKGDTHTSASRNLSNRYLGMLHHCLHTRQYYDAGAAFAHLAESNKCAGLLTH